MRLGRRRPFGELSAQAQDRELSFGELLEISKKLPADLAEGMAPDDDWEPTLIVSGNGRSVSIHLDSRLEAGELFEKAIPEALAHHRGERFAFFASSWQRWTETDDPTEAVLLVLKEGEFEEAFFARVDRDPPDRPRLGEWEPIQAAIRTGSGNTHGGTDEPMRLGQPVPLGSLDEVAKDAIAEIRKSVGARESFISTVLTDTEMFSLPEFNGEEVVGFVREQQFDRLALWAEGSMVTDEGDAEALLLVVRDRGLTSWEMAPIRRRRFGAPQLGPWTMIEEIEPLP